MQRPLYKWYQVGVNPNLPSVLVNKAPGLEGTTISEVFAEYLNALYSARKAFIQAESSGRIRRALFKTLNKIIRRNV